MIDVLMVMGPPYSFQFVLNEQAILGVNKIIKQTVSCFISDIFYTTFTPLS